jgi:hypothetical protein
MAAPAQTRSLLTSPFFEVARSSEGVVAVTRTDRAFESADELDRAHRDLVATLDRLPRKSLGLLVDLRRAPARNDPEFERQMPEHRRRLFEGFARRAVLVKTAVGKLHVQRHAQSDGFRDLSVFTDELEARTFAARG